MSIHQEVIKYLIRFGYATVEELRFATTFRFSTKQLTNVLRLYAKRGALWYINRGACTKSEWVLVDANRLRDPTPHHARRVIVGPPLIENVYF